MARKLRIQYEGAIYHVLNRGNYRRDVFETAGAAQAFVTALEEVSKIFRWRIHAYVVMRNHYHLAVETPRANLVDGMHWLQGTFATRFNRLRSERGHLFQGRYQSILVQDSVALARLVSYLHLNPVRAGIVAAEQVAAFRWSSLPRFVKGFRWPALECRGWLEALGLADTPEGWGEYLRRLRSLAEDPAEQERQGFGTMGLGWAIGTEGWRKAMAKEHAHLALCPAIEAGQLYELKRVRWTERLAALMAESGRTGEDLVKEPKGAGWKIVLASRLRQEEGAAVEWIARELHMGKAPTVRSYLSRAGETGRMRTAIEAGENQQTTP